MEPKNTFRSEQMVEVSFGSLKKSALEGLHTFFTPARVLFGVPAWGWRYVSAMLRGRAQSRKE